MKKIVLIALLLLAASTAAQDAHFLSALPASSAPEEKSGLGFRGYHLGMSPDEVKQHYFERERQRPYSMVSERYWECGEEGARAARCFGLMEPLIACFLDGKLIYAHWEVGSLGYLDARQALKDKFGKPTSEAVHEYQNRMGAKFSGIVSKWETGAMALEIDQYGSSLDKFSVEITEPARYKEYLAVRRRPSDI